jgi:tetratricopeptide (TPR) repeat protein
MSIRVLLRAVTIGFVVLASGSWSAAAGWIVEHGEPRAEIVIAEKPARSVRLAAAELREYVQKISGARLPIVTEPSGRAVKLFVGRSPHTAKLGIKADGLKYGAYRLVSGPDYLALLGDDTDFTPIEPWARGNGDLTSGKLIAEWDEVTGTTWGAPDRGLYKYRLRLPAELGLPDGVALPANAPPLEIWGHDERGSLNAVCGFLQSLGVRWYLPGPLGEIVPSMPSIALPKLDETVRPDFEVRRFSVRFATVPLETAKWAMRLGLRDPYGLMVAHGMATLTGRDEVFAKHPEWFALYGGERRYVPAYTKNQLCYSNDELLHEAVRFCRVMYDHYGYDAVSVMPPDGYTAICQCEKCAGQDQPERGSRGLLSNHVWGFVNRVAKEVARTHPDKLVVNAAYGPYTLPPTNIEKLEPNVQVVIVGGRRPRSSRPEDQDEVRELRAGWKTKTDRPYLIFENYPITERGWYLPAFVARTIGNSVNETKGESRGEDIWLSFGPRFESDDLGFNHFQVYFTAAMYWGGKNQNVEALLDEYCTKFYGPAAAEMRSFFDYCEANWTDMETDGAKADEALTRFARAASKLESGTIYAQRLALIDRFLEGLRRKRALLSQKRGFVPKLRMVGDAKNIVIDGKLDDEYWQNCPAAAVGTLRELQTGRAPAFGTTVKAGWIGNSVCFGIRCDENPGEKLNVAATKKEDAAIWYGDVVEVLLGTDMHSYYQLAVNPAGALVDYDRGAPRNAWSNWESQAEVATNVADDHWTVEIRIPVTDDQNDPLNQLVGNKPTQSLPWHLNICRQRARANGTEWSAFSPTGTNGFHEPLKFAHFYAGRSHAFDADPTVVDFVSASRDAAKLATEKKYAEAVAAYVALAEGAQGKVTDLQKSAALKQAAVVARTMKDFDRAQKLTAAIPIEAERHNAEMQNLLYERKARELIERFGHEDLTQWPFWAAGEAHFARGRAYTFLGDAAKAEAEYRAALGLTTDVRQRADLLEALGKKLDRP